MSTNAEVTAAFVNQIVENAVKQNASDIHIEPTDDGRGRLRMRVDGALREIEPPPLGVYADVVARVKEMFDGNTNERNVPQMGRIAVNLSGRAIDIRASTVPTVQGERVVLRFFPRDAVQLNLADVGLAGEDLGKVQALCRLSHGVVLCCGPMGSGKTTLMYAMIKSIVRSELNVMSIEEPIEYHLSDVAQIEVNPRVGLTLPRAAAAVTRQDPDVIMISELRDIETVQAAVQTALTGHLVITQIHVNTAPGAPQRLIDIGIEPYLVASSLGGVISQRLVRMLCPKCRQKAKLTPELLQRAAARPEVAAFFKAGGEMSMFTPTGCDQCGGSGYRGRTAVHEILIPTERMRQEIARAPGIDELRRVALEEGMKPMLVSGLEKVAEGITSLVEALRVVGA